MKTWDEIGVELNKKLDPKHVQPPPQGKYGEYIMGWHAVAEANRIFGFDGWSAESTIDCITQEKNNNGNHVIGYMSKCRLTVGDVVREDVGFGTGTAKGLADAHEGAAKEAATDALKRALRTFGSPFGLALYDKSKANVGVNVEPATDAEIDTAISTIKAQDTAVGLRLFWTRLAGSMKHVAAHPDVIAAKDKRKAELEKT